MYGYVVDDDFKWTLIGQRNPQDPQVSISFVVVFVAIIIVVVVVVVVTKGVLSGCE